MKRDLNSIIDKEVDIEKLSKKMPYKPLDESYFDMLPFETLARAEAESIVSLNAQPIATKPSRWSLTRPLSMAAAATMVAAAMVALFIAVDLRNESALPNSDEQIDDFVSALSDSDLELLVNEAESNYEFYTNI